MDEAHHCRALADRGRAALDRPGAHVAGGVDAGHAGFEQAVGAGVGAGQDEPVGISRDRRRRANRCTGTAPRKRNRNESGSVAAVGERDRLEPPSLAVQRARLRCGRGPRRRSARAPRSGTATSSRAGRRGGAGA